MITSSQVHCTIVLTFCYLFAQDNHFRVIITLSLGIHTFFSLQWLLVINFLKEYDWHLLVIVLQVIPTAY